MCNFPNLDLVNINAYAKFGLIPSICSQDTGGNKILMIIKGHNSVANLQKLTHNNPNLNLVKVNAFIKFDQISSICSQDTEQKQNSDNNQGPYLCCIFAETDA